MHRQRGSWNSFVAGLIVIVVVASAAAAAQTDDLRCWRRALAS